VMMEPLRGRSAIRHMFEVEFGRASMTCLVENIFEDGESRQLPWSLTIHLEPSLSARALRSVLPWGGSPATIRRYECLHPIQVDSLLAGARCR
jgi:hypothetical protein